MCRQLALYKTGNTLELLGLSVMIGGMLALGAFVAPTVFRSIPLVEAGQVMTTIFRRYDTVLLIGVICLLVGEILAILGAGISKILWDRLRYGMIVVLAVLFCISLLTINPKIEAFQKAGVHRGVGTEGKAFEALHRRSESLYKTELLLAVLVLILITTRNSPVTKS